MISLLPKNLYICRIITEHTYIQNTYVAVVDLIPKSTNRIKTRGQWAITSALRRGRFPLCLRMVLLRDKWIGLRLS